MAIKTTYPIVLAHGIARFDAISNDILDLDNTEDDALDLLHYYKGVRTMLEKKGFRARHAEGVAWADSIKVRSLQLRDAVLRVLAETQAEKVNIIAHSMGGLDARHMMFNDRLKGKIHKKVASITTISTPHEGSAMADFLVANKQAFGHLFDALGISVDGLDDVTIAACAAFNAKSESFERELLADPAAFTFQTYAGVAEIWNVFAPLKIPYAIVRKKQGPNDGFVARDAAKFRGRDHVEVLKNTDHLNELGWWDISSVVVDSPKGLLKRIHKLFLDIADKLPKARR